MTRSTLMLLLSLTIAGGALAQNTGGGVAASTDPAKIAAIEKHAQELKARPAQETPAPAKQASSQKAKPTAKQHHSTAKPAAKTSTKTSTKTAAKPKS